MQTTFVELICFYTLYAIVVAGVVSEPSNPYSQQQQQQQQQQQKEQRQLTALSSDSKLLQRPYAKRNETIDVLLPYFRASIPMRIFECLRDFTAMRCTKLFVLQKMEERKNWPHTGNLTKDFLDQFFGNEDAMGSLVSERFRQMTDKELNKHLMINLQKFFKNRNIKLRFLPGLMVKIIPSPENKLKLTLKKKRKKNNKIETKYYSHPAESIINYHRRSESARGKKNSGGLSELLSGTGLNLDTEDPDVFDELEIDGKKNQKMEKLKKLKKMKKLKKLKKKSSFKHAILQMALPVMLLPAILMGTFLPFILPTLKLATFTSMILNNAAFVAALIYAARTQVNLQDDQQHINYNYGVNNSAGVHRY
ncbi:hypothetical protein GQX74_015021 [Glossina fuscipes]|nr:hypothetical protein GQX74_015021 [Glossina fuscipes]